MMTTDYTALDATIAELGLTYTARFVPTPQPADKVQHPQLHWSITLEKGRQSMTVAYHQGCGHVTGYESIKTPTPYDRQRKADMIRRTCETGKVWRYMASVDYWAETNQKQPAPALRDVLYCLVMDASVLDFARFEEWANEYGYDTDSRQAKATYRLCLEQALQLRALVGDSGLVKLREAYQDY